MTTFSTIGIAVIVFITGFLGDLQRDLIKRTLGVQAHIVIRPAEEVARPLRDAPSGASAMPQVQARAQRLRSVDQWQALLPALEATSGIGGNLPDRRGARHHHARRRQQNRDHHGHSPRALRRRDALE